MFGIEVDINSEAIKAMGRMTAIASEELYRDIGTRLVPELQRQFESHWYNVGANTNTVYGVIKKIFFANAKRGLLTGSTINSIGYEVNGDSVEAGPIGNWPNSPLTTLEGSRPFSMLKKELDKTRMGKSVGGTAINLLTSSNAVAVNEDVTVSWDTEGFRVKWPDNYLVRKVYGLQDWEVKSHLYAGKKYRRGASKMEDFFDVTVQVEKIASEIISQKIDVLWAPKGVHALDVTRRDVIQPESPSMSEVEEVYKEFTGEQGWNVAQPAASIADAIGVETTEGGKIIGFEGPSKEISDLMEANTLGLGTLEDMMAAFEGTDAERVEYEAEMIRWLKSMGG